jgi:hypothetical protein
MPRASRLLVWLGMAALAGACGWEPAIVRQSHKAALVHALGAELAASVEAEKSAVIATTDEQSAAFAEESRRSTAATTRLRDELHQAIERDGLAGENERLAAFDREWTKLREIDARLLELAVANSNLKAARSAAGDMAAALDRLVDALAARAAETSEPSRLRQLLAASTAALRVQTLLPSHIASADDAEMTSLESRMRTLVEQVDAVLRETNDPAASAAWTDYERLRAEVLRLSRLNTNVVSFHVSLNEKLHATDACRSALAALLADIQGGAKATR